MPLRDECGVIAFYNMPEASNLAYYGLFALQHRGQESAGIVSMESETGKTYTYRHMGMVTEVFTKNILRRLPGDMAIGHVRYSTHGASAARNIQPLVVEYEWGTFAVAHNGNLVNADRLRKQLQKDGAIFHTTVDTEVLLHLIAMDDSELIEAKIVNSIDKLQGAFSMVMLTPQYLVAARDTRGFRPLVLGKLGDGYVVASETCAFDLIDATYIRDIEPGEVLFIGKEGIFSKYLSGRGEKASCVFELIYFARPDSVIYDGVSVYEIRKKLGEKLAEEQYVEADLVIPVPDSGVPAAIGYSQRSGIPFEMGLIRNHYIGRTFIQPLQSQRDLGVKLKLNPVKGLLRDKRVVVIDDSIVRGTTSKKIIRMLREAGAKEIHLRISSPPVTHPCYYGIDTPAQKELIASQKSSSIEEIRKDLEADTLGYLSIDGLREVVGSSDNFCYACFTGDYPVDPRGVERSPQMSLFEVSREEEK